MPPCANVSTKNMLLVSIHSPAVDFAVIRSDKAVPRGFQRFFPRSPSSLTNWFHPSWSRSSPAKAAFACVANVCLRYAPMSGRPNTSFTGSAFVPVMLGWKHSWPGFLAMSWCSRRRVQGSERVREHGRVWAIKMPCFEYQVGVGFLLLNTNSPYRLVQT